jgi:hypothetical protein
LSTQFSKIKSQKTFKNTKKFVYYQNFPKSFKKPQISKSSKITKSENPQNPQKSLKNPRKFPKVPEITKITTFPTILKKHKIPKNLQNPQKSSKSSKNVFPKKTQFFLHSVTITVCVYRSQWLGSRKEKVQVGWRTTK